MCKIERAGNLIRWEDCLMKFEITTHKGEYIYVILNDDEKCDFNC